MSDLFKDIAGFLPSILGGLTSLFKGNKQKYTTAQTPQQKQAYSSLLSMLMSNMGKGSAGYKPTSDALSMLYKQFLPGTQYTPSTGNYMASRVSEPKIYR
jgi:hypothetical protein